jgi:hypothetical protein
VELPANFRVAAQSTALAREGCGDPKSLRAASQAAGAVRPIVKLPANCGRSQGCRRHHHSPKTTVRLGRAGAVAGNSASCSSIGIRRHALVSTRSRGAATTTWRRRAPSSHATRRGGSAEGRSVVEAAKTRSAVLPARAEGRSRARDPYETRDDRFQRPRARAPPVRERSKRKAPQP